MNNNTANPPAHARWHLALLGMVLAVAAGLRFRALDWGLTQAPHVDELYFVGNVGRMLTTGSLDHGYYEYPGLLFYLLMPVLALVGATDPPDAAAFVAARVFTATCSVLGVALAYLFGRRLLSAAAGPAAAPRTGAVAALVAAAFLAVSPVHVETAHMLRADVPLELLVLLSFLAVLRLGARLADDARAGAALGLAVGLKFSGALAGAVYLVQRGWRAGPRLRGVLVATLAGAALFALVSPYALLRHDTFLAGVDEQLSYHYTRAPEVVPPFPARLAAYAAVWPQALGPLGVALAVVGLLLVLRRRLWAWLPFLLLPPLTAGVFASTDFLFARHLVPSMSVVALLAGLAIEVLAGRRGRLAWLLALAALALPLRDSLRYLELIARPSTRDRAAVWLSRYAPAPGRILTTLPSLRVDTGRFEVQRVKRLDGLARLQALHADAIVTLADDEARGVAAFEGLPLAMLLQPAGPYEGVELYLRLVPPALRPSEARVPLGGARLRASSGAQQLELLRDGRLDTYWQVAAHDAPRAWLEVTLAEPVRLSRVELALGERREEAGGNVRLMVSSDGDEWRAVAWVPGRPVPGVQHAALGIAEELLVEPVVARALRLDRRAGERPWSVAELRVHARQ